MAQIPVAAQPSTFADHATREMNRDIAKKVIPDSIYTAGLHKDTSEQPVPGSEPQTNPTRKMRR
jgi:hypothetical protein